MTRPFKHSPIFIIHYSIFIILFGGCSYHHTIHGDQHYKNNAYPKAIKSYEQSLSKKPYNPPVDYKLADCYRLMKNTTKAEELYSKIVESPTAEPIAILHYAKLLMNNEKYEEATKQLTKYLTLKPNEAVAKSLLASCENISDFKKDTTLNTLVQQNIPDINSVINGPSAIGNPQSAIIAPVAYKGGLVFSSETNGGKYEAKNPATGKTYLDLYYTKREQPTATNEQRTTNNEQRIWSSPTPLQGDINGQYHEGPASFSKDETTIYFTRSNYKKVLKKSSTGENNLKIFKATASDTLWKNVEELFFNNDDYSNGHPSITEDGSTMYFISDMPGGNGETDIYTSKLDGLIWGTPENMGNVINTASKEMFPYFHSDTLYFSSEGHNTMGGFDVFYSVLKGKTWTTPTNLNYPLNSSKDDYCYRLNSDNKTGFVVSNRSGTDKIYEFTKHATATAAALADSIAKGADSAAATHSSSDKNKANTKMSGFIKGENGKPVSGVRLEFHNRETGTMDTLITGEDGRYYYNLMPNTDYRIFASKAGFFTKSVSASTKYSDSTANQNLDIQLVEIVLGKQFAVERIYYELNSAVILPEAKLELDGLVQMIKQNHLILFELSSHTDSRANDEYNMKLSERRAKSAVDYLISKGVRQKNLYDKGYGETKLLNRCKNDVECTEEEHKMNRRTEITVIKID